MWKDKTFFLGADHGGFAMKEFLRQWLQQQGATVEDCGAVELSPDDDYPGYGEAVARAVSRQQGMLAEEPSVFGILVCRSGGGMTMIANRFRGVRAAGCRSGADARHERGHNNLNVVVLEGDHLQNEHAQEILEAVVGTPFAGGRHLRRLEQYAQLGEKG